MAADGISGPHSSDAEEPSDEDGSSDAPVAGSSGGDSNRPSASERTWIHPAELPSLKAIQPPAEPSHSPRWIQIPVGVAAALVLIAGISYVVAKSPTAPTTQTAVLSAVRLADAPAAVGRTARAMTVLTITGPAGTSTAPGIALVNRHVITTTASIPSSALVYANDLHGRPVTATSVHTDPTVGLTALIFAVPITHAVASVTSQETRGAAIAVSRSADGPDRPVQWSTATVRSVDALLSTSGRSIGSVAATSPLNDAPCTVLMSPSGRTEAISAPALTSGSFLPASFAADLTTNLITSPEATHGHLGISGTTASGGGAEVVAVSSGGPSDGVLAPGDVIVAVDGENLTTASEMVDAVYLEPPGSTLDLTVRRNGTTAHRDVTLATSP